MRYLLIVIALFYSSTVTLAQCAMCAATVDSNKGETLVGAGLNSGILFLMVTPYLLIGTVAIVWYKNYLDNKKKDEM